jgi:biopolymer transport protein ExbB
MIAGAQDVTAPPPDPAPATEGAPIDDGKLTLLDLIKAGGLTMVFLGGLSIAVAAFAIRNYMTLKAEQLLRPELLPGINQQMADGDISGALQTCRTQECLLTTVLANGLLRIVNQDILVENVEKGFAQEGQSQMTHLMRPINYLLTIGSIAPMVGLLGTVSGMIKAFQNISAGGMGKPEVLAENIGEALVTTATGLIIAIPAMLFYYYFKNVFADIISKLNKYLGGLLNSLESGQVTPIELSDIVIESHPEVPQA